MRRGRLQPKHVLSVIACNVSSSCPLADMSARRSTHEGWQQRNFCRDKQFSTSWTFTWSAIFTSCVFGRLCCCTFRSPTWRNRSEHFEADNNHSGSNGSLKLIDLREKATDKRQMSDSGEMETNSAAMGVSWYFFYAGLAEKIPS